jgi:hypothetical protein
VPLLPLPTQCIWCKADTKVVPTDVSHVLPRCLGNAQQQTLPPGVICTTCNSYFGKEIEPRFLRDPLIHVIATFLQVVDPSDQQVFREKLFDSEHQPTSGVQRGLGLDLKLRGSSLELGVTSTVSGTLAYDYSHRELRFLSRAIHKIAFESLAWQVYVADSKVPETRAILDPLSVVFDPVRRWGREGHPMNRVRPVFRKPSTKISGNWDVRIWANPEGICCEVNLFSDWYGVSLTSVPDLVEGHLRQWTTAAEGPKWMISDRLIVIDLPKPEDAPTTNQTERGPLPPRRRRSFDWLRRLWR